MESWRRKPGRGILKEDFLRRNLRGGILGEESWKKDDPRRGSGGTSKSSGGAARSPPKTSGASLEPPGPLSGVGENYARTIMFFFKK